MVENAKEFASETEAGSVETQELLQNPFVRPPDANDRDCDAKDLKTDLRKGLRPFPDLPRPRHPRREKLGLGERLLMSPPPTQLAGIGHWCHSL